MYLKEFLIGMLNDTCLRLREKSIWTYFSKRKKLFIV
jgi:hypothetical protein